MTETIEGDNGDLVSMIVAPGRTVQTGNDFKMQKVLTQTSAGTVEAFVSVPNPGKHTHTEGETVSLPRQEAMRLHATGFLLAEGEVGSRPFAINAQVDPNAIGLIKAELR